MKNIQLIFTFFTLWLSVFFSSVAEEFAAFFFILTLGILHGANDIGVGVKTFKEKAIFSKKWILFIIYILSIGFVASLLLILPSVTLLLFVVISSYHFGEQHWNVLMGQRGVQTTLFLTAYGLLIFSLLFNAHVSEVVLIIEDISSYSVPPLFFSYLLWISFCAATGLYLIFFYRMFTARFAFKQLFYILLFSVVFYSTSLLWAFAIYFIFWHSLPSLVDQMKFLYGSISTKSLVAYMKDSFIYWAGAIGTLCLYYFFLRSFAILDLSMFFAFLTALTVPHIVMMFFLKKSH